MKATLPFSNLPSRNWDALPEVRRFADYLSCTGWTKIKQSDSKIFVFGIAGHPLSSSETPIIIVPSDDSYSDSKLRIYDAIVAIARFQNRPFADILAETFHYDIDVLRQRIDIPRISGIPLKVMPEIVRYFRELICKAAQLEDSPQGARPYRLGKSSKAIQKSSEVAKKCLFGHTFAGSFGISIEMPITLDTSKFSIVTHVTPTFERLIMQRIATGLIDATNAKKDGLSSIITDNIEYGFNADICGAMGSLLDVLSQIDEISQVEYVFQWSPLIVPDSTLSKAKSISFVPSEMMSVFRDAAKEMDELHKSNPVTIKGEILTLADDPEKSDKDEKRRRTITIRCKNKPRINVVKITLSDKDYDAACIARGHRNWISVKGILIEEDSSHRLRSPQNLKEVDMNAPLFNEMDDGALTKQ